VDEAEVEEEEESWLGEGVRDVEWK